MSKGSMSRRSRSEVDRPSPSSSLNTEERRRWQAVRWSAVCARLTRKREVSVKRGSLVTVFTVDLWQLSVSRDLSFGNVSTRLFSRSDCGLIRHSSFSRFQSYPDKNPKESSEGAAWWVVSNKPTIRPSGITIPQQAEARWTDSRRASLDPA